MYRQKRQKKAEKGRKTERDRQKEIFGIAWFDIPHLRDQYEYISRSKRNKI